MTDRLDAAGFDLRRARAATMLPIAIAFPIAVGLWVAVFALLPPLAGMAETAARLALALKCSCVAILFCFGTAIEAVAHERLRSPAIDPLSGYETRRMRINLRYLQNTLEQLVLFVPGLFGLAYYLADGSAMRAVPATAAVWILARIAFWIGYHRSAAERGYGAPSMMVGLLLLLYVSSRFGFEVGGPIGAAVPLVVFFGAEAVLFRLTRA